MKIPTTKIIRIILLMALATAALAVTIPVFLTDRFTIRGGSMLPTLHDGQHVFVNKLLMGARIYTKYDFSDPVMESFRMPGLRNVRPEDIVIFNYPYPDSTGKIHFRINYVYAKRCIGETCPMQTPSHAIPSAATIASSPETTSSTPWTAGTSASSPKPSSSVSLPGNN